MPETSKTVNHALRILSHFSRSRPVLNGSELARELKLPRTSVLRLLATLESFGFIERDSGEAGYRIGMRAFEVGTLYLATNPISGILTRALDRLADETQCTAYLAVLDKSDVVILTYREGSLPIRFIWKEGDRILCTTTSLGKAILMHLSRDEIDQHLGKGESLPGLTEHSLRTRAALDEDLSTARQRGWALAQEESHAGITAVASAVLDETGYPIAAINVSFFDYPRDPARMDALAKIVLAAADDVSKQISLYGPYGSRLPRDRSAFHASNDRARPKLPTSGHRHIVAPGEDR